MSEETRYIKQNGSVQQRGQSEEIESLSEEEQLALDTIIEGGSVRGKEGGLRVDMFEHDDPEDLPCICDLPAHAQDIIMSEVEL
tara:strand:+ start:301 stop:552 length:252 start_codon:yes stop_codon:yes gene_type:complete